MNTARLLLFALVFLSLPAKTKHTVPRPAEIRKYGCSIGQHGSGENWTTYVWALLPGDDIDCNREIDQWLKDGRPVSESCFVEQLSMRDTRDRAYSDCSHWMDEVRKEILDSRKPKK